MMKYSMIRHALTEEQEEMDELVLTLYMKETLEADDGGIGKSLKQMGK